VLGAHNTAWNGNVVFGTLAGVNLLAESVPESRNLHLKFQKKFCRGHTPGLDPHYGKWRPFPAATLGTAILAMQATPGAGTQAVMMWCVPFV